MPKIAFIGEPRASQNMLVPFLFMQNAVNALGYSGVYIADARIPPEQVAAEYDLAINMRSLMYGKTAAINRLKGWKCDLKLATSQYAQWLPQVSSSLKAIQCYQTMDSIPDNTPLFMKNIYGDKFGPFGYRKFNDVAEFKSTYTASQITEFFDGVASGVNYLQAPIPDGSMYQRTSVMSSGINAHLMATYSATGATHLSPAAGSTFTDVTVSVPTSDPSNLTPNLTTPFAGDIEWFDDGTASDDKTLIEVNTRLGRISTLATSLLYGPDVFKDWIDCTVNRKVWNPTPINQSVILRSTKDVAGAAAASFTPVPYSDLIPAGPNSIRSPLFFKLP